MAGASGLSGLGRPHLPALPWSHSALGNFIECSSMGCGRDKATSGLCFAANGQLLVASGQRTGEGGGSIDHWSVIRTATISRDPATSRGRLDPTVFGHHP